MTTIKEKRNYVAYAEDLKDAKFTNGKLNIGPDCVAVKLNPDGTMSVHNPHSKNYQPLEMSLLKRKLDASRVIYVSTIRFTIHSNITVNDTDVVCDVIVAPDIFNLREFLGMMGNVDLLTIGDIAAVTRFKIEHIFNTFPGNVYAINAQRHERICSCLESVGLKVFQSVVKSAA